MKKILSWYQILKDMPQFTEETPSAETTAEVEKPAAKVVEKPKKAIEKKAPAAPKAKVAAPRNPSKKG